MRDISASDYAYILIVGSSALSLAWLISAGLHQAETGRIVEVWVAPHGPDALCLEAISFAVALGASEATHRLVAAATGLGDLAEAAERPRVVEVVGAGGRLEPHRPLLAVEVHRAEGLLRARRLEALGSGGSRNLGDRDGTTRLPGAGA